jgi:hypothetical protein
VVVALASLAAHVTFALAERFRAHETDNAHQAAAFLGRVRVGPLHAWRDGLILSVVLGVTCLLVLPAIAFIPILIGLYLTEHAYVRAAQLPPLS